MEIKEILEKAKKIKEKYAAINKENGERVWAFRERAEGLVGDVGDLMKLIMVKDGYRTDPDVDKKLAHELSDCLWSILILADELKIDIEKEFGEWADKELNV